MYLKSLTLRGFKSFASSTTLELEPGITCVVGPNGSGKSNVVDALAWVMGEQGAKSLRGGKMEDVIFAGTSGRPPLGRAEVVLTIDNTDGALPIEYSEVTISRTMFRNGGSEYAINGTSCRLLDVQELLSDSGIGREMHVIVGQGQLDSVLRATPEDRRGFVEEAAGVLKHRKRKEKALRKLDATQGNLTRLQDVLTELRRQLKPLGRQAEVARRAVTIQADVRDARARLLADDIVTARTTIAEEMADEAALKERRAAVEHAVAAARQQETELEDRLREDSPALSAAQETWYALSGLRERLRGTSGLATERVRLAAVESDDRPTGRDPEELEAEARRVEEQHRAMTTSVEEARAALEAVVAERTEAEATYGEEERRVAGLLRAAADRREGLARLRGQVNALKSRAEAADAEVERLGAARDEALRRADEAQKAFAAREGEIAGLSQGESGLDEELEAAEAVLADVEGRARELQVAEQDASRRQAALAARVEALETGLARKDGAGALLAASDEISGLLGSVAALLTVRPGFEAAIASALGSAADAVAVDHVDTAVTAMELLKSEDLGRAGLLLGGEADVDDRDWPGLPEGATYAVDVVEPPATLVAALRRLLFKVAVVDDLAAARALVAQASDVTAVTREGDVLGAHFASGGSSSQQSLLEVQAAIDTEDPEGAVPPSVSTRSGGPGSLVAWDGLGYAGKLFVYEGPRGAEIAAFTGRPAKEPIRAYVGLRTSDEPEAAARLALDELIRAGAFDRRVLVIASPTGTGWLENDGLAPLEVMLEGDTAIVGVQYSYLPSPMSLILEPDRAGTSARALFNVVHGHWRTLDPATRPALYLFGLSLGSLASENSISFSSIMGDPVQGAVWAGPTFRNPIWRNVASNRAEGSPAWSPVFEDSSLVRVLTPYSEEVGEDLAWGPLRIVYVVNPSDAISYFRESMWLVEPDWFRPPRSPDISDLFQWSPVVSLFQVAIDMQFGAVMPDGHGHNYALRDYARAWASVVGQDDWSDADTERLGPVVRTTVK